MGCSNSKHERADRLYVDKNAHNDTKKASSEMSFLCQTQNLSHQFPWRKTIGKIDPAEQKAEVKDLGLKDQSPTG